MMKQEEQAHVLGLSKKCDGRETREGLPARAFFFITQFNRYDLNGSGDI